MRQSKRNWHKAHVAEKPQVDSISAYPQCIFHKKTNLAWHVTKIESADPNTLKKHYYVSFDYHS